MSRRYDAVIIGGGHNGLVAAALLERAAVVGGAAVTEELIPGFRVSTGSYVLSLMLGGSWTTSTSGRRASSTSRGTPGSSCRSPTAPR